MKCGALLRVREHGPFGTALRHGVIAPDRLIAAESVSVGKLVREGETPPTLDTFRTFAACDAAAVRTVPTAFKPTASARTCPSRLCAPVWTRTELVAMASRNLTRGLRDVANQGDL